MNTYCVGQGSQVLLPDFTEKPIEDVVAGDSVLTYDRAEKQHKETKVINVSHRYLTGKIYKIYINNRKLSITDDHKIASKNGTRDGWITPESMFEKGTAKLSVHGMDPHNPTQEYVSIDKIEYVDFEGDVYNLETEDGTYIVNCILVQDCKISE